MRRHRFQNPVYAFSFIILSLVLFQGCAIRHSVNDYRTTAATWQASSAEAAALYRQGFNLAGDLLEKELKKKHNKPIAITTDIDQTVLDTSGYTAWQLKHGKEYPNGWGEFVHRQSSPSTPGSADFLKYADEKGVTIFYVTNRKEKFREPTMGNLKKVDFPQVTNERVFLKTKEKGKTEYYEEISKTHKIILMLGDNLADFDESFDEGTNADRNEKVAKLKDRFGRKYIVFPNAMYGGWERAHLKYRNVSAEEKGQILYQRTIELEK